MMMSSEGLGKSAYQVFIWVVQGMRGYPGVHRTCGVGLAPVACDLRPSTPDGRPPRTIPVRLRPDAIPSAISSNSYNDRRTPGINTHQPTDHDQASNKLRVALTG